MAKCTGYYSDGRDVVGKFYIIDHESKASALLVLRVIHHCIYGKFLW